MLLLAGLLTVQLAITAGVTALFIGSPAVKSYVYSNQVRVMRQQAHFRTIV